MINILVCSNTHNWVLNKDNHTSELINCKSSYYTVQVQQQNGYMWTSEINNYSIHEPNQVSNVQINHTPTSRFHVFKACIIRSNLQARPFHITAFKFLCNTDQPHSACADLEPPVKITVKIQNKQNLEINILQGLTIT